MTITGRWLVRVLGMAGVLAFAGQCLGAALQEAASEGAAAAERLGIVRERPAEGPFVEIPGGFMVPYTAKIPGTDIEFEMVPIPGGEFLLGSPEDDPLRRDDEGPQIKVTVDPFWMGKYEVTWGEYKTYMRLDAVFKEFGFRNMRPVEEREADAVTAPSSLYDPSFTFDAGEEPDQPAATMTQFAAKQYTKYLSLLTEDFYRLPTEAEWEYACRAGTTTPFYFGDDEDQLRRYAWFSDNSDDERKTVGKKRPNAWGLYDMYGNVAEWVLDGYSEKGYAHWADRQDVRGDEFHQPTQLYPRVLRGGSFELDAEDCRSAARMASHDKDWKIEDPNFPKSPWWYTDSPATGVGFRLLRPLSVPAERQDKEKYWAADIKEIEQDYVNRIRDNGRGALGVVDPQLPAAIEEIKRVP